VRVGRSGAFGSAGALSQTCELLIRTPSLCDSGYTEHQRLGAMGCQTTPSLSVHSSPFTPSESVGLVLLIRVSSSSTSSASFDMKYRERNSGGHVPRSDVLSLLVRCRDASTERHLQVGLLTAAIGAGATGIGLLFKGTSQKKKAGMQLRQLEDIGRQHGWRISLEPDLDFKRLQARATYLS
jgi:hypothetical protein